MEEDLNFLGKWKMTSICLAKGRQPQFFRKMEEEEKQFVRQLEDNLHF
jgi:hypothetical protein